MKLKNININNITTAGCLVFNNKAKVLLIIKKKNTIVEYQLPKGKVEVGEDNEAAAKRETLEETGVICEIVSNTPIKVSKRPGKKTLFYLAIYKSGTPRGQKEEGILSANWIGIEDACSIITAWQQPVLQKYKNEIYKLVRTNNEPTII